MIGIIDYDAGNIRSVEKALHYLGQETVVSRDPDTLLNADTTGCTGEDPCPWNLSWTAASI